MIHVITPAGLTSDIALCACDRLIRWPMVLLGLAITIPMERFIPLTVQIVVGNELTPEYCCLGGRNETVSIPRLFNHRLFSWR